MTTIRINAANFTIVTTVFIAAAAFTPRATMRYIAQMKKEPKTTVCQPCFSNTGKNSPNESLSITAKATFPIAAQSQ